MVKITPKVRTILLCLLLIGSCFTTYAFTNLSFLTPSESGTNVSFFEVSKDEQSSLFRNFSLQKNRLDNNLSIDISEQAIARFNPSYKSVKSEGLGALKQYNLFSTTSTSFAKPAVNIGTNTIISVCSGVTAVNLPYTNATESANKFTIDYDPDAEVQGFKDVGKTTFAGGGSGNFPLVIPSNSAPGTYNAILKVHNNQSSDSESSGYSFKITIKGIPTVNKPSSQAVCNNQNSTAITFSGNMSGVTYNWTNNTPSIGIGNSGTGNIAVFNAKNSGNAPVTGTITVTPSVNGCTGAPQTFSITVNPTATFTKPIDVIECNNEQVSAISFSGSNVTGSATTYKWANNNTSIGLPASGTGNIAAFTATNGGNAPISGTIAVTPTANGCDGTPQTFKITVNPTANFTKPSDVIACNNDQVAAISFSGSNVTGSTTTYKWINDNTSIGLPASGTGNIAAFTASNGGNAPISGTITVTPTANDCEGTPQTFKITVNPTTAFTKPTDIIACNDEIIPAINFTGATVSGTTYNWTNDNPSIGLVASGNGNIAAFTAKNGGNAPLSGTITVTPIANGCEGTPQTFKITVNPTTAFTKPTDIIACNDESIPAINFTGATVSGTTYSWTNDNPSIGLVASGTGNIAAFTASNDGSAPISGTITVTPTANDCDGTPQTFTITVNPTATVTIPENIIACNDGTISELTFSGSTVTNTTYSWTNDNPSIGLAASGNGNIAAFTATNTTSAPITGTITVTPTANNCAGTPETFEITVNPSINIEYNITNVACNGENNGAFTITNTTGGNGDYRYSLTNSAFNTTNTFTGLTAGIYTIYVQDTAGCTYQEDITVEEPLNLDMSTTPTSTPTSCFGGSDGTITSGTVIGGNGNYVYSIDNNTFSTSNEFTGLAAGSYTIFVKDDKECALQVTINVEEADELSATLSKTNASCFDGNDGTITVSNPTGGSGNYEYKLDNGLWQTNSTFADLSAGSYNVSIRDSSLTGCEVILNDAYQLSQPATPITSQISATRTTTYGTPTGTATATPTGGTPGYTYQWRVAGTPDIIQTTKTATNLNAGDYEVTIIDTKGCSLVKNITVIDALEAFIVPISICEGDEDSIRTSYFEVEDGTAHGGIPGYSYEWTFGAGATISSATGPGPHRVDYNNTGNKNIVLIVTDSLGKTYSVTEQQYVGNCYEACGKSNNLEFNPDNIYLGTIDGVPVDLSNCNDTTPKYIFLQVDKASNIYNPYTELNYTISNGIQGSSQNYFTKGCRDKSEIDDDPNDGKDGKVGEFIRLTSDPINYVCGDNLDIDSFYITWTNNSTKRCGLSNNAFCYSTNEPVIVPTLLDALPSSTPINCKGAETGIITVKASGGFAPYSYSLTGLTGPFQPSNKFTNLKAGSYTVYVKGARGQTTSKNIAVTEPATIVSATVTATNPVCFGDKGEATVTGTGGTQFSGTNKYEYLWNDSLEQTTATASNLIAGDYTVTVIDANGCQVLQTVTITDPPQLTVATTGEDHSFNCGFNSTTLDANSFDDTIERGTWSILSGTGGTITEPNNPISTFSGTAGIYELQWNISDLDGNCGTSSTMTVTFDEDCSQIDFDGQDDHVLLGDNYGLTSGSFTFEVWVKLKSTTGVRTVVSKRNSKALGSGGYDLIVNNGAPTFRWGNNSVTTSSKLTTNRWYHLGVIYDNSKVYLYVDGINVGNKSLTNPTAIANPFIIGAMHNNESPDTPVNYFHGWIEELRIWNVALETEQLRFMMNQRLELNTSPVIGTVLPVAVPNNLSWNNLTGYYQLLPSSVVNGVIPDLSSIKVSGELKNIQTNQENTAPIPYISNSNGVWSSKNTWLRPNVWDYPNAVGINGEKINWNIARTSHNITSGGHDISLLGLLSESNEIKMLDPDEIENETNAGQGLTVTHYLSLDGSINLIGDSQLIQSEGSILESSSSGFIEKDQQGTASSYNYNYWSSPVVPQSNALNSTYSVASVLMDGTISNAPRDLDFGNGVTYADGAAANPRKISNYWIYKFRGKADEYSDYQHMGSTGILTVGEGFTMKGTSGNAAITDRQNYVFKGKPNNGDITLTVGKDQNYLLGNPYPSALDANKFILDNLSASGGTNTKNIFNGALYFWDHFGGKTHTLREYVGGYATYNLIGGVKAIATDDRINSNTDAKTSDENVPGQFIPVGQGFFINTVLDDDVSGNYTVDGGDVVFRNSQRAFKRESPTVSHFLSQEKPTKNTKEASGDAKIRLDFKSPLGYLRQILVGTNEFATNGFDLGYDAPLNDYNVEDFFWLINDREFVIQGVSNFAKEQVLPVGMYISQKGKFSIEIYELENIPDETEIYLKDIEKDKYYDLRDSKFEMEIESGDYFNRFEIVFSIPEDYNPNAADEDSDESDEDTESKDDSEEDENSSDDTSEEESSEETDNSTSEESEENSNQTVEEVEKVDDLLTEYISILDIDIHYMSRDRELSISNPFLLPIKRVEIYNLLGQQIQKYIRVGNQKEIRLPVSEYATGIYVVKLYSENSQISKNIMLKQ